MVGVESPAATAATVYVSSHRLCPAGHDGLDSLPVRGQHARAECFGIRRRELTEYVRNFELSHDNRTLIE